ncbi:MAG: MFS transporter [Gemmatimonadaceae bacterium]|nr:MFS transporter [Chitinophagaceae bacterium]
MAVAQQGKIKSKLPRAIPYIIGNEAAERFSFYGMQSILSVFLVTHFYNPAANPALVTESEARANELVHLFASLAYFTPLIGGIMADWFFGKYKVILTVSIVYTFGHLVLAMFSENLNMFTVGLVIVACCAGAVKSCVSANVGDQFDKSNEHLLSKIYGWFYFTINTGSLLATYIIPIIYRDYGPEWAFGVPGILMFIATVVFWLGRKKYVKVPPTGIKRQNFVTISAFAIQKAFSRKPGQKVWDAVAEKFTPQSIDGTKAVYRVLKVFAFTPIFWALWYQCLSEWVLQATKLDLTLFGDTKLEASQVSFVNPLFLVTMIPVFTYGIYPFFKKIGINPTPLRKIGAGLVVVGIGYSIVAMLESRLESGDQPSIWWQILAYWMLSASEILVSITCLEYAYTQSPPSMKSTMSALYLLGISLGNYFVSLVNGNIANKGFFSQFTGSAYYWLFVKILAAFIILYLLVSKSIKEKSYVLSESEPG